MTAPALARPDLGVPRAATWDTILTLHREQGYPMPADIETAAHRLTVVRRTDDGWGRLVDVRFDPDDVEAVNVWGRHLGLPPARRYDRGTGHRWYKTRHYNWQDAIWLGWNSVEISTQITDRGPGGGR